MTAQDVGGDPAATGGSITIVNNAFAKLTFIENDQANATMEWSDYVSLDGGATRLTYEFLGYGDVRGDPKQHAGFIRVHLANGQTRTFAIDTNADGDNTANLQNGNTKLAVADLTRPVKPAFTEPACFTTGTLIETDRGPVPVEALRAGALVRTMDHGLQPLRAVMFRTVPAEGALAPIRFAAGALGNTRALTVSPQHRMVIADWRADVFFGESEVFVAAKHLVNGTTVCRVPGGVVTYFHLLFDRHEVVFSEGVPSESHLPDAGDTTAGSEMDVLFPRAKMRTARPEIRARDARLVAV